MVSNTVAQFAHDHGKKQNTLSSPTVVSFTRGQKMVSHAVILYKIGVCT